MDMNNTEKNKMIIIAWNSYHTRNEALAEFFGLEKYYIGKRMSNKFFSFLSYFYKFYKTVKLLFQTKPNIVFITNTFFVLPLCVFIVKKMSIFDFKIVLDTHTCGIFNSQIAYPEFLKRHFAKRSDHNIVTNSEHEQVLLRWKARVFILPDPPLKIHVPDKLPKDSSIVINKKTINIVYINTYSQDEPYEGVIKAFENINQGVNFYITGRPNRKVKDNNNITHTGFLNIPEYRYLIANADVLIVLTKREDTFQCGGHEALSLGKPLITSNTKYLKEYFYKGTIHVGLNSGCIANGIKKMIQNIDRYKKEMLELKREKEDYQKDKKNKILNILLSDSSLKNSLKP